MKKILFFFQNLKINLKKKLVFKLVKFIYKKFYVSLIGFLIVIFHKNLFKFIKFICV